MMRCRKARDPASDDDQVVFFTVIDRVRLWLIEQAGPDGVRRAYNAGRIAMGKTVIPNSAGAIPGLTDIETVG
jgi:hypothetical protein